MAGDGGGGGEGVGEMNFSQLCPHECGLEDRRGPGCACHRVLR